MIVEMKEDLYLRELSGRKLEVKKCRRLAEGVERGGLKNRGKACVPKNVDSQRAERNSEDV